jgi:hypothetical protein
LPTADDEWRARTTDRGGRQQFASAGGLVGKIFAAKSPGMGNLFQQDKLLILANRHSPNTPNGGSFASLYCERPVARASTEASKLAY